MKAAQIRKHLQKQSETLFFNPAERALLAVLEAEGYRDPVSAAYTNGAQIQRARIFRAVENAWNGEAAA